LEKLSLPADLKKIERLDFATLRQDIAPFLVHPEELSLFDKELIQEVVRGYDFA
jgi:hypothetical protein